MGYTKMAENADDEHEVNRKHHIRQNLCATRPAYREGRHPKAVKVYTVNQESCYLLLQGVPALGVVNDLIKLCALYGAVEEYRILHEYPTEDFQQVIWVKYQKLQAARIAKRKLDDCSFFGGVLHACYAPEYETADDTRAKLLERRREVARRIRLQEAEQQSTPGKKTMIHVETSSTKYDTDTVVANTDSDVHATPAPQNPTIGSIPNPSHHALGGFPPLPPDGHNLDVSVDWRNIPPPPFQHPIMPWEHNRFPPHSEIQHRNEDSRSFAPCSSNPTNITHNIPVTHAPYPSMTPGKYSGSTPHETTPVVSNPAPTDRLTELQSAGKLVVKEYKQTTGAAPKFVPRQLGKGKTVKTRPTAVDINSEQVRLNACVLGPVSGPTLPNGSRTKDPSTTHTDQATVCDASYGKTISSIRQTIKQVSSTPQEDPVTKKQRTS